MSEFNKLDPVKVARAAERHGVTREHILHITESMERNTRVKPWATLETILKAKPANLRQSN